MAREKGKMAWWKILLIAFAVVAILTGILYLEVYIPMFKYLEATATPGV